MLNFKDGHPIAIIKDGDNHDKIIYLDTHAGGENDKKELLINSQDDGKIYPIPNPINRECCYIAGPSGSGKSTYISHYVKNFKKMYPKRPVFVFSRVGEDEPIDELNPIRIAINQELIDRPIQPVELAKSIVIFDDTDTIPQKDLRLAVNALKNDILETGRHYDIYILITSHLLTRGHETRIVLSESTAITVFPASGAAQQIRYALRTYYGLTNKSIDQILHLPSRWVTLYKNYPQYVMWEKGIKLLSTFH